MAQFMSPTTLNSLREVGKDLTCDACPDGTTTDEPLCARTNNHGRPSWARFLVDQLCCFDYAQSQLFSEMTMEQGRGSSIIPDIPGLQSSPPSSVDDEDDPQQQHRRSIVKPESTVRDETPSISKGEAVMVPPSPPPEAIMKPPQTTTATVAQATALVGSYHVYAPERMSPPLGHGPRVEMRAAQKEMEMVPSSASSRPSLQSSDASLGSVSVESYSRRRRLLLGRKVDNTSIEDDECSATLPLDDSSYWSASTRSASINGDSQASQQPRHVRWSPSTQSNQREEMSRSRGRKWQRKMKSWTGGGGSETSRGRKMSRDRVGPPRTIMSKSLPDATYIGMTEGYACGGDSNNTTMCEV